jgi:hypothetical protein
MKHSKAIELLTLILKGDDPRSHPDYHQAIRVGIQALCREMLLGIDEDETILRDREQREEEHERAQEDFRAAGSNY